MFKNVYERNRFLICMCLCENFAVKAGGMRIVQDKSHLRKKTETSVPEPQEELKVASRYDSFVFDVMSSG